MTRVRHIDASNWLALAGAGLYLLGVATPLGAPQEGSQGTLPSLARRADSRKPTWHSGPASTPPQTEILLPPHPNPPPAKSPLLGAQAERNNPAVTQPGGATPASSGFPTTRPSAAAHEPAPKPNATLHDDSNAPDPEAQRIRVEFNRLRNDAGARRAFYDELRRTVEQVRAGQRDEDSKSPPSSHTAWHKFRDASREPPEPPATAQPDESAPANPLVGAGSPRRLPALGAQPQASFGSLTGAGSPRGLLALRAPPQASLVTRGSSLPDQPTALPSGAEEPNPQDLVPPPSPGAQGPSVQDLLPPRVPAAGAPNLQDSLPPPSPGAEGPNQQDLFPPLPLGREEPGVRGFGVTSATVDRAAYRRVVRCAKANGAPVPLALGVAWIESHLQTYPPRGAAGEVGMFQILPARCRMEGFPAQRLKEPEFNAWLGTRLLARYYREERNWARAAAKYVAGPRVFDKSYSADLWAYINWYASSVDSYAGYFARYQS